MDLINMEPVIDSHVHILPPFRLAGLMRWIHRYFPAHPVPEDIGRDGILEDLKGVNVKFFFNLVYPLRPRETEKLNRFNFELVSSLPNSAGWGSLHPENEDKKEIVKKAILEYGFLGMKFHPFVQKFSILDSRMKDVYETLNELRRPLFIHTGFDEFYQMKLPPAHVGKIAAEYPDMPIIISHIFFPVLRGALDLMAEFPQVIADLTNVPGSIRVLHSISAGAGIQAFPETELLRNELPRFSDRVLFGSDHPAGMGGISEIYRDFHQMELPRDLTRKILWDNPMNMVNKYLPGKWVV